MEFIGIVVGINPIVSGHSEYGFWQKQDIIFKQKENSRKVCVTISSKTHMVNSLKIGDEYNVSFYIESREYNGKWYTNIRASKIIDMDGRVIYAKIKSTRLSRNKRVEYDYEEEIVRQFERQCEYDERQQLLSNGNIFDVSEAFGHNAWALNAYLSNKNR